MARKRTRRERLGSAPPAQRVRPEPVRDALRELMSFKVRPVLPPLSLIEDRRVFHPERDNRPALSVSRRSDVRRIVKSSAGGKLRNDISARIGFAVPENVVTCIRRKQRKEVLHAYRYVGKGSASRIRRRNWRSDIDCT